MKRSQIAALLFGVLPLAGCSSLGGEGGFSDYSAVNVHRV